MSDTRRRLLVVSPSFPPVNAADMQRVRMSLPYYERFGWTPYVLAVSPSGHEVIEPLLEQTIPAQVQVERVASLSPALTRKFGFGNVALRAMPYLYAAGARLIAQQKIDLVYFSTTMFLAMPLGRLWKRRFAVPYVLDMQDPWRTDYYDLNPHIAAPPKYSVARRVNAALEPWTMRTADGLIAVSSHYIDALRERYLWLRTTPAATVPFGAAAADFDVLAAHPQPNSQFTPGDGRVHGVYAGRGGADLATAVDIVYRALRIGLDTAVGLFEPVMLHFVGTDYATDARRRPTLAPAAAAAGLSAHVVEDPARAPFFGALQLLKDANFLLLLGSNDASYSASKVYPYILARKPLLAVVHESSPLVRVLKDTGVGVVVTFASAMNEDALDRAASQLASGWRDLLERGQASGTVNWQAVERYSACEMTRQQCTLFDRVLEQRAKVAA